MNCCPHSASPIQLFTYVNGRDGMWSCIRIGTYSPCITKSDEVKFPSSSWAPLQSPFDVHFAYTSAIRASSDHQIGKCTSSKRATPPTAVVTSIGEHSRTPYKLLLATSTGINTGLWLLPSRITKLDGHNFSARILEVGNISLHGSRSDIR